MTNLIRVKDAAALLGLSECTIFRKVERDEIPHVRIGRSIRFRPEALNALIAKREHGINADAGEGKGGI